MSKPISVQLYSVRQDAAKDFPATIRRIAGMGYAGVEFAGLHGVPATDIARLLNELGIVASSAHTGIPTPETIDNIVRDAETLGYTIISTSTTSEELTSRDDALRLAERLQCGAELAAARGLTLGMHNHWWEFEIDCGGQSAWEVVMSNAPALAAQLDVYWCALAGANAAGIVATWAPRIPTLHIKDGDLIKGQPHKAVGAGKVNMAPIVAAADDAVLQWLIVELDDCATDMMAAVEQSCRYLIDSGLGTGRS